MSPKDVSPLWHGCTHWAEVEAEAGGGFLPVLNPRKGSVSLAPDSEPVLLQRAQPAAITEVSRSWLSQLVQGSPLRWHGHQLHCEVGAGRRHLTGRWVFHRPGGGPVGDRGASPSGEASAGEAAAQRPVLPPAARAGAQAREGEARAGRGDCHVMGHPLGTVCAPQRSQVGHGEARNGGNHAGKLRARAAPLPTDTRMCLVHAFPVLFVLSFHFPFPMHSFRIPLGSNFNATSAGKPSLTSQTR